CSLMFPGFFGGEAGVSGNRSTGSHLFGLTFGPQIQMYYLVAAWLLLCTVAMHALSRTPLGRMANAVRDNPERAQFVGYDPQRVRFMMVALSGFFAGVAGGLAALNYEIVTAESLSARTSGLVLLATYLGGMGFFFGPLIGASVVTLHKRLWDTGQVRRAGVVYAAMALPVGLALCAVIALVEMAYHASGDVEGPLRILGRELDANSWGPWIGVLLVLAAASLACRWTWRRVAPRWHEVAQALAAGGAR